MMFSTVEKYLGEHIENAEQRCQAFEEEASGMKQALRMPSGGSTEAAAIWWWTQYISLKDAISTLIDGKIRHEYDRHKAVRTPNSAGIHWQKAGLRTGESQDNLRGLLKKAGNKHAVAEFDVLDRRLEDVQENLKAVRLALVHDVRAVRVSGWGEESQEFRFSRGGGCNVASVDVRLRPPCGDTLEECCCSGGAPPGAVEKGSLRAAAAAGAEEEMGAAAAAVVADASQDGVNDNGRIVRRVRQIGGRHGHEVATATGQSGAERNGSRKRRLLDDDDDDESDDDEGWQDMPTEQKRQKQQRKENVERGREGRRREEMTAVAGKKSSNGGNNDGYSLAIGSIGRTKTGGSGGQRSGGGGSGEAATSSLDEIKRQMGKNPLDLVRSRNALEEEMLLGASAENLGGRSSTSSRRTGSGAAAATRGGRAADSVALSERGDFMDNYNRSGASFLSAADGGQDVDVGSTEGDRRLDDGAETAVDWKDGLMGMPPHERAELYEEKGMYREALRWHRQDLSAARKRMRDGEEEDDRPAASDFARALRNTGRCLGKLDMEGFAEAKAYLSKARELVGPDGPSPSPAEEQDVVLELGTLWYTRHVLCGSEGLRFIADEALEEAVRYYRECRELCVDLLADLEEREGDTFDPSDEASKTAIDESRSTLLRAEFNLGMALVEKKAQADALPHLLAVQQRFRELSTVSASASVRSAAGATNATTATPETTATTTEAEGEKTTRGGEIQAGEATSDLTGLYASSLVLLAECYASSSALPALPLFSSTLSSVHDRDDGRDDRGTAATATTGCPTPLGAPTAPMSARLSAAVKALETAAHTFLDIGDPGAALEALQRLVKILRLLGYSRGSGERKVSRVEVLCDRASLALPPLPPQSLSWTRGRWGEDSRGDEGEDDLDEMEDEKHDDDEVDDTALILQRDLQQIWHEISNLREHWGSGGTHGAGSRKTGQRTDQSSDARRSVVNQVEVPAEKRNSGNSAGGTACETAGAVSPGSGKLENPAGTGTAGIDNGCSFLGRVGPGLSAPGFARRRRTRATSSLGNPARGLDNNARGRTVTSVNGQTSSRDTLSGQVTVEVPLASEVESAAQHPSGRDVNSDSPGAAAADERSFAQLRAAIAEAALEGGAINDSKYETEEGGLFSAYKDTCRFLQVKPKSLVLSRLLAASRRHRPDTSSNTSDHNPAKGRSNIDGVAEECRDSSAARRNADSGGTSTLDLKSCRLSDRELQVVLHAIAKESAVPGGGGRVKHHGSLFLADNGTSSLRLDALLLSENPGIGAGGLAALSGLGGGGSGGTAMNGLFQSLVRLDLSRCNLKAADLIGLASRESPLEFTEKTPAGAHGVAHDESGSGLPYTMCSLRALELNDNPFTRMGVNLGSLRGSGDGAEVQQAAAERGLAAFRNLIAQAPSLDLLDVSGCSQLPTGPSACLYSETVSAVFAAALASGLTRRFSNRAADASHGGYGTGNEVAQMSTLRLGRNTFSRSSWERVLFPLSIHPPRELHLERASSLSALPITADGRGESYESSTPATKITERFTADDDVDNDANDIRRIASSILRPIPRPLSELLAATVLPADAPGVETLNLTGSTGLLLLLLSPERFTTTDEGDGRCHEQGDGRALLQNGLETAAATAAAAAAAGAVGEEREGSELRSDAPLTSVIFRDALMSPLCRTTHLMLSGVRGRVVQMPGRQFARSAAVGRREQQCPAGDASATAIEVTTDNNRRSIGTCQRLQFGPRDVLGFCEAASACSSLRYLDLAGSDLSGPHGAASAAAAISCLLRYSDVHGTYDDFADAGHERGGCLETGQADSTVEVSDDGGGARPLMRLSLRACQLGIAGLSAVLEAVAIATVGREASAKARLDCGTVRGNSGNANPNRVIGGVQLGLGPAMGESLQFARDGGGDGRRCQVLAMLPRVLDLSHNRHVRVSTASAAAAAVRVREREGGGSLPMLQLAEAERVASAEVTATLRLLGEEGVAFMATTDNLAVPPSLGRRKEAQGTRSTERACIDLSGNRLGLDEGGLCTVPTRGTAVSRAAEAATVANGATGARRELLVAL